MENPLTNLSKTQNKKDLKGNSLEKIKEMTDKTEKNNFNKEIKIKKEMKISKIEKIISKKGKKGMHQETRIIVSGKIEFSILDNKL